MMKQWYYKMINNPLIRGIEKVISIVIRIIATLDVILINILQLDVFPSIVQKFNMIFSVHMNATELKTQLYVILAFTITAEVCLRGIRYLMKPEIALLKSKNRHLEKINRKLRSQNEDLQKDCKFMKENYQNTISGYLQSYAKNNLGFGTDGHYEDRITLFSYDRKTENFVLQARYASNEDYNQNGKFIYPKKGLLYKAFNVEEGIFDNNFPLPKKGKKISKEYKEYQKKQYGLSYDTTEKLTMKSTSMFGYVIKSSSEGDKIGVVIVESTERDRFSKEQLLTSIEKERKIFRHFIEHGHDYLRRNLKTEGL